MTTPRHRSPSTTIHGSPATAIHGSSPVPSRAILAILGTIVGLVLLVSFRTPDSAPLAAARITATPPPGVLRPAVTAGDLVGGGSSPVANGGLIAGGGTASNPTPVPTPAPTSAPTTNGGRGTTGGRPTPTPVTPTARPAATPAPTAAPAAASGDAIGPVEGTPFGNVQVEVKMSGGRITAVIALQLPSDRRRSAQISQYVSPILHDEALQAQSAQIDGISGATWTSGGYQASLQGALDKLTSG